MALLPNCLWPVLAHGHPLGLCWGARPSRWPFSASRHKPSPKLNGFTSSLIPAFSPRRRRNARRLFEKPATGLAERSTEKSRRAKAIPSPRKVRMRASVNTNFLPRIAPFVHPKPPLGLCRRPVFADSHHAHSQRGRDGALRRPHRRAQRQAMPPPERPKTFRPHHGRSALASLTGGDIAARCPYHGAGGAADSSPR
jgi:hypothetical protein